MNIKLFCSYIGKGRCVTTTPENLILTKKTGLTFWEQSQRLPCCTCGSSHQEVWWQCSLTSWRSWRCRLCKASPQGSGFLLAGNLASGPKPIPAGRTLSCCPPALADRLPYPGAGERQGVNVFFSIDVLHKKCFVFF